MNILEWLPWVRERRTAELADELDAHLEMAVANRVARGESPADAAANARRELGNPGLVQEVARDQWSGAGAWIEQLAQDVRFALRVLRQSPVFAVAAILTIALGVGATAAVFSVVDATLLHPLPYPHAEQLVRVEDDLAGTGARDIGMSTPEWHDLARSGVFEHVSPTWYDDNNFTGSAHPQRVSLLIVAPNYFSLLGVKPRIGVAFDPSDATPGFNGQAIISDGLSKRAFGSDSSALGRIVQLDSDSYRIVGVMPPGFQAPGATREERGTEAWVAFGYAGAPMDAATVQSRAPLFPGAIARLKAGASLDDAQRRIDALVLTLRRQYPGDYPARNDWRIRLVPLRENIVGDIRQPLLFLFGAVGLVLLIGCANVANLLLARASTRRRELAVRQALGGSPSRLIRQLLTESVLLSSIGGALGIAAMVATRGSLARLVPSGVPRVNEIAVDWRVVVFSIAASVVAGAIFGLAPALGVRRLDVTSVLKEEGRGSTGAGEQKRTRRLLVIAEFALSLVLLSAAGLLLRSFATMLNAPLGFDPRDVTVVHTRLPYPNDAAEDLYPTAAAEARFAREVIARLRALRGVDEVALGSGAAVPLGHPPQDQTTLNVLFERGAGQPAEQPTVITGSEVTPGYFRLLRMKLIRGRLVDDDDTDGRPLVAVINDAMARTYWPNENPVGRRVKLSRRATEWTTIVGIVSDTRGESLASAGAPQLYAALYQRQGKHLSIFLRGRLESAAVAREVRAPVQTVNTALPVFGAQTLDETVSGSLAVRRFSLELIALFAVTALLLAALGLYGVISYMVSERTQELGVRLALGAQPADVLRLILRQGLALAVSGAAVGLTGAVLVSRAMESMLVGVGPFDPLTLGSATALLTLVAFAGCYLPARRAVRVDPVVALRGMV
jgi:predicted permease